jgi:hypothetical protein
MMPSGSNCARNGSGNRPILKNLLKNDGIREP